MAQIAQVLALSGQAVVVSADGVTRPLRQGDVIETGEVLRTLADASVVLQMNDGQFLTLAPEQELRVDDSMAQTESTPTAQDASVQIQTPEQVIQALETGGDLMRDLAPAAAGPADGGGGGGGGFVRLLRIVEGVEPLAYQYGSGDLPQVNEVLLGGAATAAEITVQSVTPDQNLEGLLLVHHVTLSGTTGMSTTFSLSLGGGTASKGLDYDGMPVFSHGVIYDAETGTITVPAGVSSFTVTVASLDDTLDEPNEQYELSVGGVTAAGTIVDTDVPTIQVGSPDGAAGNTDDIFVPEGNMAVFAVQLMGVAAGSTLTLSLNPSGVNPASEGGDYKARTFEYSLDNGISWHEVTEGQAFGVNAGDSRVLVRTDTTDDAVDEHDETFTLGATLDSLGVGYSDNGVATIVDNDTVSVLSVTSDTRVEGVSLVHTVTLSGAADHELSFAYGLNGNTATPVADYTVPPVFSHGVTLVGGQLVVPAGVTSFTITTATLDDSLDENSEFYDLSVGGVGATGTITDNDFSARVSEEGLQPLGLVDNLGSAPGNDRVDSAIYAGVMDVGLSGGGLVTLALDLPSAPVQVGDTSLTWRYGPNHAGMIASDGSGDVIKVVLNSGQSTTTADTVSYAVELLRPLDHPLQGTGTAGEDTLSLNLKFSMSDASGRTTVGSLFITVEDDSPRAMLRDLDAIGPGDQPLPGPLQLDESTPDQVGAVENDGMDDGVRRVVGDFSAYFVNNVNHANGGFAFGGDGPGRVSYHLDLTNTVNGVVSLVNQTGIASGFYALDRTDRLLGDGDGIGQGAPIFLFSNPQGEIVGKTAANSPDVYFKLSVDSGGVVSFELPGAASPTGLAIWHPLSGSSLSNHDEAGYLHLNFNAAGGNGLTLTQTVVDADGDMSSVAVNLAGYAAVAGQQMFSIEDDGPQTGEDSAFTPQVLLLDESAVDNLATPAVEGDGVVSMQADYAGLFKVDIGTDGLGSVQYSLRLTQATPTGERDVTGVGSGLYALDGTDLLNSDGDGIGQGMEILLYRTNATTVEGRVGGAAGVPGSVLYFTISVDAASGSLEFARNPQQNIWHNDSGNPDDGQYLSLDGGNGFALQLMQTVTDGDGDTGATSVSLAGYRAYRAGLFGIEDDGPPAPQAYPWTLAEGGLAGLLLDESPLPPGGNGVHAITGDFSRYFDPTPLDHTLGSLLVGTDRPGQIASYELRLTTASGADVSAGAVVYSGLHALEPGDVTTVDGDGKGQGAPILLFRNAQGEIEGRTSAGSADLYFKISVGATDGVVTFTQSKNIWHSSTLSSDDKMYLSPTGAALTLTQTLMDADGDTNSGSINLAGQSAAGPNLGSGMFGIRDDGPSLTLGVDQNNLEQLNTQVPDNGQYRTAISGDLRSLFTVGGSWGTDGQGHLTGWGVDAIGQAALDGISFAGVDAAGRATNLLTATGAPVWLYLESGSNGSVIVGRENDAAGVKVFQIEIVNTAVIGNPPAYQLQTTQFQEVGAESATVVGGTEVVKMILTDAGAPLELEYRLERTDADGDSLRVSVRALLSNDSDSHFTFVDHVRAGGGGNETLMGTSGDDLLLGGPGSDSLVGGLGADVFKWQLGDSGTQAAPAIDRTDFRPVQGDALDLHELLVGEHSTPNGSWNLSDYLSFGIESAKLVLRVDPDGAGTGGVTQKIVLEQFADTAALAATLPGYSGTTDADLIKKLVEQGNLKLDP